MSSSPLRVALHLSLLLSAAVSAPSKEFYGLTLVTNSPATFGLVQLHGATGAGAVVGPAHKQLFGTGDLVAVAVRILMSSFPPPDVNVIPESHSCLVPSFTVPSPPPIPVLFPLLISAFPRRDGFSSTWSFLCVLFPLFISAFPRRGVFSSTF